MPISPKMITRKIKFIAKDLQELKKISSKPLNKYLDDYSLQASSERYLERIIGRMIDINYHILTEEKGEAPIDFFNSFIDMGKNKYIPIKLSQSLANAAGLRNRLAHEYDEIDEKWVAKNKQSITYHLKKAAREYDDKREKETPLQLLEVAYQKLTHDNMDMGAILIADQDRARKLAVKIKNRADDIEKELYQFKKEQKKLRKKHAS